MLINSQKQWEWVIRKAYESPTIQNVNTLERPTYFEVLLYVLLQCSKQFPSKFEESCFSRFCEFCGSFNVVRARAFRFGNYKFHSTRKKWAWLMILSRWIFGRFLNFGGQTWTYMEDIFRLPKWTFMFFFNQTCRWEHAHYPRILI